MSSSPLISIITINYNDKVGLERTLKSITNQTYQDFEYLVIDGNSKDGSKDIIEKYQDKIDYWISEPDKGIYNAMNKGIKKANGKYLLFINSGDELYNSDVLNEYHKLIHTEDFVYFDINIIGEQNSFIKKYPSNITFSYLYQDTLPHPATFIKKYLFEKVGLYDERLKIVSDWKFFILALAKHNVSYRYNEATLSTFYLDGISSNSENFNKLFKERDTVIDEHFPLLKEDMVELTMLRTNIDEFKNSKKTKWLMKLNLLNKF